MCGGMPVDVNNPIVKMHVCTACGMPHGPPSSTKPEEVEVWSDIVRVKLGSVEELRKHYNVGGWGTRGRRCGLLIPQLGMDNSC